MSFSLKIPDFWYVTPCTVVCIYQNQQWYIYVPLDQHHYTNCRSCISLQD